MDKLGRRDHSQERDRRNLQSSPPSPRPSPMESFRVSQPPPPPQSHGQRVCILGPGSVTMKWDGVVNRYKCQFLSSHLSTSGFFLIYQQVCDVLSLAVCTLRSFNSAFYVHMLFTFFHGVSWQRIKYIYFKGVWELLLHVHLQLKRRRTQFHF